MPTRTARASGKRWRNTEAGSAANVDLANEFAAGLLPIVMELRERGLTLDQIAAALNVDGIKTRHGRLWRPSTVQRVLARGKGS